MRGHYTFPSFFSLSETILLYNYRPHQPLIVMDDPNGNCEIYVVLNNTITVPETIQEAINNGHIALLGSILNPELKPKIYKWVFQTNDINTYDNICLYQDILKVKENVKIFVGGSELDPSNWDFFDHRQYMGNAGNYYTQHISFNPRPADNQELVIIYTEYTSQEQYQLILDRDDGQTVKNKMCPLTTANSDGEVYYLSSANISDEFTGDVTYTNFSDDSDFFQTSKNFSNVCMVKQFPYNFDFESKGMYLEMWVTRQQHGAKSSYPWGSRWDSSQILRGIFRYNNLSLYQRKLFKPGHIYRFRFININNMTVTEFFDSELSLKKIDVFSTDKTVSTKTYEGFFISPRII